MKDRCGVFKLVGNSHEALSKILTTMNWFPQMNHVEESRSLCPALIYPMRSYGCKLGSIARRPGISCQQNPPATLHMCLQLMDENLAMIFESLGKVAT